MTRFLGTLSQYQVKSVEQQVFLAEVFSAYNKLIEARRLRMFAVNTAVAPVFWLVIIAGAVIMIFMTFFLHISLFRTHLLLTSVFSIVLGLMIFLIAAVDNPFRGQVSVSPEPFRVLLNGLNNLDAHKGLD
jgi:hypothetical protein